MIAFECERKFAFFQATGRPRAEFTVEKEKSFCLREGRIVCVCVCGCWHRKQQQQQLESWQLEPTHDDDDDDANTTDATTTTTKRATTLLLLLDLWPEASWRKFDCLPAAHTQLLPKAAAGERV